MEPVLQELSIFFRFKIIPYCNLKKSYTIKTISEVINLRKENLIYQEVVKKLSGKDAPKLIYEKLVAVFEPKTDTSKKIEY